MKPKGIGIHVFAGGFTMGVKRVLPVVGQLEIHDFGRKTCEAHGTKFMNADKWQDWFDYKSDWNGCRFCYGNPRCTAFSSYSAGCSKNVRGATAAPTQDIWDLCNFGVKAGLDLISFESVQQAYTVGRPLLCRLRDDVFAPKHYRIAHVFVNTAAEGNAQRRRRYFFIAYRDDRNFNVYRPTLPPRMTLVGDVLGRPEFKVKTKAVRFHKKDTPYDANTCHKLPDEAMKVVPYLREKEGFSTLARNRPEELEKASAKYYETWITRTSNLPFSLHAPTRLKWDGHCPAISSTSKVLIHPHKNRTLTVGEIAALMGWPQGFIPVGPSPVGQIGKGVVPATGKWLAEQIEAYFNDDWGDDDYESSYCHHTDVWYGKNYTGSREKPLEKIFRMTYYLPPIIKGA